MGDHDLTKEERNAINTLKRLAKRWPPSLWVFCTGTTFAVMKCGPDGHQMDRTGSVDQAYHVDSIGIPNDGGDW